MEYAVLCYFASLLLNKENCHTRNSSLCEESLCKSVRPSLRTDCIWEIKCDAYYVTQSTDVMSLIQRAVNHTATVDLCNVKTAAKRSTKMQKNRETANITYS